MIITIIDLCFDHDRSRNDEPGETRRARARPMTHIIMHIFGSVRTTYVARVPVRYRYEYAYDTLSKRPNDMFTGGNNAFTPPIVRSVCSQEHTMCSSFATSAQCCFVRGPELVRNRRQDRRRYRSSRRDETTRGLLGGATKMCPPYLGGETFARSTSYRGHISQSSGVRIYGS